MVCGNVNCMSIKVHFENIIFNRFTIPATLIKLIYHFKPWPYFALLDVMGVDQFPGWTITGLILHGSLHAMD